MESKFDRKSLCVIAPVLPYFVYSEELKIKAPLISYSCEWFGLNLGMKLAQMALKDNKYQRT